MLEMHLWFKVFAMEEGLPKKCMVKVFKRLLEKWKFDHKRA
jgi:hypothetical protein